VGRSQATPLSEDVTAFLRCGLAIVVATRDDELQPEIARGWGPAVAPGGTAVTLCVSVGPASRTRANLERNGAIAVTCSRPSTYRTVQLKGVATDVRDPSDAELDRVRTHLAAFVEEVAQVGLAPQRARAVLEPDLAAVTLEVRELYDQTPGPNAGSPL
jgi:hypothetical protein